MFARLQRLRDAILTLEDGLMALMLTAMILLAVAQIVMRNLFDSGLVWADPALRMLVLWLALMGAIAATREDRHIRIDLLSRFLSPGNRARVQILTHLFSALICGLLAWHSLRFVIMEWQDGAQLFNGLPAWLGEGIIPLGFAIMALRFLFSAALRLLRPAAS